MNTSIFKEWFHSEFVPSVKKHLRDRGLPAKAILLLDNAPSHPSVDALQRQGHYCYVFTSQYNTDPANGPGVLKNLKRHYQKSLLRKLLLLDEEGHSMVSFVKTINIKDAVYMSATAWDQVKYLTLAKSWLKLLGNSLPTNPDSPQQDEEPTCEDLL